MIVKLMKITCDECFETTVSVPGSRTDEAWRALRVEGWRRFKHPSGAAWRNPIHVCRLCVEYGRPYRRDAEGRLVRATERLVTSRPGMSGR